MLNIPEITARYEAATDGRWRWEVVRGTWELVAPSGYILSAQLDFDRTPRMIARRGWPDAEFIAHARTDIPQLVTALEEAQGKLDAVEVLALEGACPGCLKKMDEACLDDGCNWARQFLRILKGE